MLNKLCLSVLISTNFLASAMQVAVVAGAGSPSPTSEIEYLEEAVAFMRKDNKFVLMESIIKKNGQEYTRLTCCCGFSTEDGKTMDDHFKAGVHLVGLKRPNYAAAIDTFLALKL